ncbi:hypothetical protein SAMN05216436_101266 [bacterium A37T11]|nr:hypothetical protein SAMN05216436_101266 [bacterium A37T11]
MKEKITEKKPYADVGNPRQANKYDKVFRENMRHTLPRIIKDVLKLDIVSFQELKDKIQITKEKEVDTLRLVTDSKGAQYILQLEYESENKPYQHFRMAEYRAMLSQIHQLIVKQYVIYVGESPLTMPHQVDEPGFKFEYTLIRFADLPHELFLSSEQPEEQILTILADLGDEKPYDVIEKVLININKKVPGPLIGNKYFEQLRVIVNLRNFGSIMEEAMLKVSSFFKEERDPLYRRGEEKKSFAVVENLIVDFGFTDEQAAKAGEVSIDFVKKVRASLAKKQKV